MSKQPEGSSVRAWHTTTSGTTDSITCEWCGTEHPAQSQGESGYQKSVVMGRVIVDECCGAVLDRLYEELGEPFAMQMLEDYAAKPADEEFALLQRGLQGVRRLIPVE